MDKKLSFFYSFTIIIILGLGGCSLGSSMPAKPTKPPLTSTNVEGATTGVGRAVARLNQAEMNQAENTLVQFFSLLKTKSYDEALELFAPDDWEAIANIGVLDEQTGQAVTLQRYCEATATCLEARVISGEMVNQNEFRLTVKFINDDGTVFRLGPCCGATEEEIPTQTEFPFTVKKIEGQFKVATPPVYRP